MHVFVSSSGSGAASNLIIGIIMFILGVVVLFLPQGNYQKVDAHVISVEEYQTDSGETEYRVHAEYTVDGVKYDADYNGDSSIHEGEKVKLEYDTEKPANFKTAGADILPFVLMGVGVLFALVGLFPLLKKKNEYYGY